MLAWLESIAGPAYATAMMWTLGALLLLVVILLLIKVIRSLSFGTFVSGGRNRKTRLAVMDATAVDSHRRLVLVRRDDVEHLILIGGPTDVVVEQNIRLAQTLRRPSAEETALLRDVRPHPEQVASAPAAPPPPAASVSAPPAATAPALPLEEPEPPARPAPVPQQARPQPVPAPPPAQPRPVQAAGYPRPTPPAAPAPVAPKPAAVVSPAPAAPQPSAPPVQARVDPAPRPAPSPAPPRAVNDQPPSLDDALLEELEVTLDRNAALEADSKPALPSSVEDEMAKLLGDLARPRR